MNRMLQPACTRLILIGLAAYRVGLAPFIGGTCRFTPSCSSYAEQAVGRFGAGRGTRLALRRVLRCHPWGGWGFDPVPGPPDVIGADTGNGRTRFTTSTVKAEESA